MEQMSTKQLERRIAAVMLTTGEPMRCPEILGMLPESAGSINRVRARIYAMHAAGTVYRCGYRLWGMGEACEAAAAQYQHRSRSGQSTPEREPAAAEMPIPELDTVSPTGTAPSGVDCGPTVLLVDGPNRLELYGDAARRYMTALGDVVGSCLGRGDRS